MNDSTCLLNLKHRQPGRVSLHILNISLLWDVGGGQDYTQNMGVPSGGTFLSHVFSCSPFPAPKCPYRHSCLLFLPQKLAAGTFLIPPFPAITPLTAWLPFTAPPIPLLRT